MVITQLSLHTSQVVRQVRAYFGFFSMKPLEVVLLLPGKNFSPPKGYRPPALNLSKKKKGIWPYASHGASRTDDDD